MRRYLLLLLALGLVAALPAYAAGPTNYRAHLSSEVEGKWLGQGQALFKFSPDGETVEFKLIAANIENITVAHIHLASAPGQNGPPVLFLYGPQEIPGRFSGVLSEGTATSADLVGPLVNGTLDDLQAAIRAGLTYVNLHTVQNPGGEIRGTIH